MKENCKTCRSSKPVDKATVKKSARLQASIDVVKTSTDFVGKKRREKIAVIKESAEYLELLKVKGLISLTEKSTDPKDGSVYVTCSNAGHLKDEKAEGIVHKYYFKCPHFAIEE